MKKSFIVKSSEACNIQKSEAERKRKRERSTTSGEKPGLSPCCLFIHLCLQDLFPLSKVRGATKECVSSEQEEKMKCPAHTVSTGPQLIFLDCISLLKNHLGATFFDKVGKLWCAIGWISNINTLTFSSEKHWCFFLPPIYSQIKPSFRACTLHCKSHWPWKWRLKKLPSREEFETYHSSSTFSCRHSCSWPLPSFPDWHSLDGVCVCLSVCVLTDMSLT